MKKIILSFVLLCAFSQSSFSQCAPFTFPFTANAESANVPELPDCIYSGYLAFSSNKTFKTTAGPIDGFSGNVFIYDTTVSEGITMEDAGVVVTIGAIVDVDAGTPYQLSFKYGTNSPAANSGSARISFANSEGYIYLPLYEIVATQTPSDFLSEVFTIDEAGTYYFTIEFHITGGHDDFYLDDINVQQGATASVGKNLLADLAIYPNPVKDFVNITGTSEINRAEVYAISGQKVLEHEESDIQHISTAALANGVYILKLHSGNAVKSVKIVKE